MQAHVNEQVLWASAVIVVVPVSTILHCKMLPYRAVWQTVVEDDGSLVLKIQLNMRKCINSDKIDWGHRSIFSIKMGDKSS